MKGGMDGTLLFWNIGAKGSDEPVTRVPYAVSTMVWGYSVSDN
jgi:polyadenylation factor subunit 2